MGRLPKKGQGSRPTSWQEALRLFLLHKQAEGKSERTLQDYENHVTRFFSRHPRAWDPGELQSAALEYMAQPAKPAYFNLKRTYLGAFLSWCAEHGYIPDNPLAGIKRRRAEGRVVHLNMETLQQLLELPDRNSFAGLRDYALILLTLDTGIRPKEAFSLLPEDVNLAALEVYVRGEAAKTRISRTLPISQATGKALAKLLAARHPAWGDAVPVLCTEDGRPMNNKLWHARLSEYGRRLGVKLSPYSLRHAFALEFLRGGGNVFALQRILGHRDLTMTKRYVNLLDEDLKSQHYMASPANRLTAPRYRVRTIPQPQKPRR